MNTDGYQLSHLGGRKETCASATKVVMEEGGDGTGGLLGLVRWQEH